MEKDKKEKVSVLMSVYNEAIEYIEYALDSIVNQTYDNLEIIIVNDNPSNVQIRNYLERKASIDHRILLVNNKKNIGLAASLNHGLQYVTSEYVVRMDADDISSKQRIEKQMIYMKKHNCDLVSGFINEINEDGNIVHYGKAESIEPKKIEHMLRYVDCVPHPLWFVKKYVYDELNGYRDIYACEDYDFLVRALKHGFKIGLCNDVLLDYRIRENSISNKNKLLQFLTSEFIRKYWENIEDKKIDEAYDLLVSCCSDDENRRYLKALNMHNKTIRGKMKYNLFIYIYCCCLSKYYRKQLKNKIRRRLIMNLRL